MKTNRIRTHNNHNFLVYIGEMKLSFSKISNLTSGASFEELAEGGLNDRVHYLVKPSGNRETLTLERGVTIVSTSSLKQILENERKVGFAVGQRITKPIVIIVSSNEKERKDKLIRTYSINDPIVTKWDAGSFDASSGEILIENFEISHTGITYIV